MLASSLLRMTGRLQRLREGWSGWPGCFSWLLTPRLAFERLDLALHGLDFLLEAGRDVLHHRLGCLLVDGDPVQALLEDLEAVRHEDTGHVLRPHHRELLAGRLEVGLLGVEV